MSGIVKLALGTALIVFGVMAMIRASLRNGSVKRKETEPLPAWTKAFMWASHLTIPVGVFFVVWAVPDEF